MKGKGHNLMITARDKEVTFQLLNHYQIPFKERGKGKKGFIGKMLYNFRADYILYKIAATFKPDLFLSFGSPYAAQVAWLAGKPHIAFDDTDHNPLSHALYVPFTNAVLTPRFYLKDQGEKQIRFDGFMELCSLHPNRFVPNAKIVASEARLKPGDEYVVLRFVSWNASHDIGLKGLALQAKYLLVHELSKYIKVIISSEAPLPDDLKEYAYTTHPANMHDLLYGATLLVGESLTMAAEAAFLGTPALCISTAQAGTLDEEVKLGLIELFRTSSGLLDRAIEILKDDTYKDRFKRTSQAIIKDKIDVTAFMVWFVENYPKSFSIMKQSPEYQNRFK
jgi:uncharacterized protein